MSADQMAIFAFFRDASSAKQALAKLKDEGIGENRVAVMYPDVRGHQDYPYILRTKVKKGAMIGGVIGAVLGFIIALVLPLFVTDGRLGAEETITNTRIHLISIILATPILGLLGMACGALVGIGTPGTAEERYKLYSQSGGVLLSVHPPEAKKEDVDHISDLLGRIGGQEIHLVNEEKTWNQISSDWSRIDHWPSL